MDGLLTAAGDAMRALPSGPRQGSDFSIFPRAAAERGGADLDGGELTFAFVARTVTATGGFVPIRRSSRRAMLRCRIRNAIEAS